jgi:hypothetical protein
MLPLPAAYSIKWNVFSITASSFLVSFEPCTTAALLLPATKNRPAFYKINCLFAFKKPF